MLFATLDPDVSSNLDLARLNVDLVLDVLKTGADPNAATWRYSARGRTAWHLLLRGWTRLGWRPDFDPDTKVALAVQRPRIPELDDKISLIATAMLKSGAMVLGTCCVTVAKHKCRRQHRNCRRYPVREILATCAPDWLRLQSELEYLQPGYPINEPEASVSEGPETGTESSLDLIDTSRDST